MSGSLLVGAPVTEKESDLNINRMLKELKAEKDPFADPFAKSETEILVEIEAKILEVDEDAFLDASKDLEGSPSVIPDSEASILLNALTREEATVLLSAPVVTVKNGEKATIKVVQEFVFPAFPTGKPSIQATGEGDGRQVKEIGFELSVTPTVQKNNQIQLQLNPKVTQFDGFIEYGGPSDPTGGIGFSKRLPSGIQMPIFSVKKTATQTTTLSDGATAIIDGLTREEIKKVNEKIPVLGNLPLVGELFSTESNQTRSLIMFVSAKIASTESSPDRENIQNDTTQSTSKDRGKPLTEGKLENLKKLLENLNKKREKLKAEVKQLDEQLNKVNKRLAEITAPIDQPTGESPKSSKVEIIGIGARLIDVNGACTIAELIPGGPAEKSQQLEPKDVILGVSKSDGTLVDVSDMKLSEIVELIKGPKNSKVKLLIQPFKNPSTPKEVSIKRKPFHIYHQTHENKVSEKADPVPSDTPSGKKLIFHIVKRGDTVKSIAKEYGSRVKWIVDANQLTGPKKIKVGEKISVPQKKPMTK
jgi:LysM repeat protein